MSLERILASKGSSTSLARCRDVQVYGKDMPDNTFLLEFLCTPEPETLLCRFSARRKEVVHPTEVLGNGMLQVVA